MKRKRKTEICLAQSAIIGALECGILTKPYRDQACADFALAKAVKFILAKVNADLVSFTQRPKVLIKTEGEAETEIKWFIAHCRFLLRERKRLII